MIKALGLVLSVAFTLLPLAVAADENLQTPAATPAATQDTLWVLRMPRNDRLVYRGLPDLDKAGLGSNGMLYPAPNALGFLAGVMTHGLLVDQSKQEQKMRLQEAADQVWAPFLPVLENFGYRELMQRALPKAASRASLALPPEPGNAGERKGIESTPVFSMTQDSVAIVLDNTIMIHSPSGSQAGPHQTSLRVISSPRDLADPVAYWTANDGENLKDENAVLMALSLDIALLDMTGGTNRPEAPYRTVRYLEGGTEKMERAQILASRCERLLLRTLRGALMSVPASSPATGIEECKTKQPTQPS